MIERSPHTHAPDECYQERIQELAESCDHEFHMSALHSVTNKERAIRGRKCILLAVDELKELQQNTKCTACREEINRQITLQEEGLKEIDQVWKSQN